ncbi:glycoside hydrolase superfamily [Truncatella angustata]|uniref:Alpha-glucuronidase n=1 Tax=Truncatella angustata TaxID=152316 RepID=A0A9P8USB9_9PEZI|nr:glycoside hydrolase superfamily [Truncatella angustata]KAH6658150.1 glycoside hydrolase superfamily [Truncatella angustata]KAH8198260.1 hypothetical protein TruAng_007558 [Truncatella angustata]
MMSIGRLLFATLFVSCVIAEDGLNAWLRYAPIPNANCWQGRLPSTVISLNTTKTSPVYTAGEEIKTGLSGIFGLNVTVQHELQRESGNGSESAIIVGTVDAYSSDKKNIPQLIDDGFYLDIRGDTVLILGQNERGALYGAFEYLSRLAQGVDTKVAYASNPDAPIRWVNQWDNLMNGGTHGSVERGYGGSSIFFWDGFVRDDLTRVAQYARILASIGINGIVVNNVNANATLLSDRNIDGLGRIADAFRPWGIQIGISLLFSSPRDLGGLTTFDPLDQGVINWWHDITDTIYTKVPNFAGYLIKASAEGQPGPLTYNRTLADGANLFAKAVKPHGGIVMFRAFVYDSTTLNQTLDWKADRANAAVQFFDGLDSKFEDNVVIQIKYGPIDFQVREPVSPLFAHLRETGSAIELEISQEYLGQQAHLVYLAPMWKEMLDLDLRVDSESSRLKDIIKGQRFNQKLGGYAGVVNAGTNTTWLGSHTAMSNLYAYGRLAWNPDLSAEDLLESWTKLTFGHDELVVNTIKSISMSSWPAYENYTGNLGIQTLTNILLAHYGPNPASQDGNPWGQWTRADGNSIGMDRTVWNGTGFAGQYPPELAARYEKIETTPDNLLLWFHHVQYNQPLKSGLTVIQHIYDAHYNGAATAQMFTSAWESLKGLIDAERYEHILYHLVYQAGHSIVWRDSITNFYFNKSGIADERGRVGNYIYRIEAEDMQLDGYKPYKVLPIESASKGVCIVTSSNSTQGTATTTLLNVSGKYNMAVNYFDMAIGNSSWELYLDDNLVGKWKGDVEYNLGKAPTPYIDGQTATRITFRNVDVKSGAVLKVVGTPDGLESAPLDYISILPLGVVD